jgi:hypothetical protein
MFLKFKNTLQILVAVVFILQLGGCIFVDRDHDHDRDRHYEHQEHHDHDSGIDVHLHGE